MRHALILTGLLALPGGAAVAACETGAGEKVFNKCRACHTLEPGAHLMGPSLHGILGRRAGQVPGFTYSAVLAAADFTWTEERLSAFLADPMGDLPGNTMPFGGLKNAAQRDALLCLFKDDSNRTRNNNGE